jgi:hypothetical protein
METEMSLLQHVKVTDNHLKRSATVATLFLLLQESANASNGSMMPPAILGTPGTTLTSIALACLTVAALILLRKKVQE